MNPPLPKPTPPAKTDDKQQSVVFDQNKTPDAGKSGDTSRISLTQKPSDNTPPPSTLKQPSPPVIMPSAQSGQPAPTPAPTTTPVPKPPLPPSSLSALSSMSSNKIPGTPGVQGQVQSTQMPQKTVLGQPIPQAIRGEATPPGMGKQAPGMPSQNPQGFAFGSPRPSNSPAIGTTTTTTTSTPQPSGTVKQESPNLDGKNQPKIAQARSPILKFLPFIVGGLILLIVIVFALSRFLGGGSTSVSDNQTGAPTPGQVQQVQRTEVPSEQVTLEYWGLWEPSEVMNSVISDFENENPGIQVNYVQQSSADYRERLQTAIQGGSGPDLFRFHASWVPMLRSNLDPIPASVASVSDFRDNYYPVVSEQLVSAGQYVGLPLMYDGLVLYYNEDILATADETPPSTWPELRSLAVKLTVPSADGIQRGGLAIGNATNVEHFSDILATLILQNGGNLSQADSVETRDALLFYTNFQIKDKVWNNTLPSSTVAFARGDVAMMFAPSWRAHEIKALNPDLNFSTAPMPQLSSDEKITWGTYWAEGISSASRNKTQAASFLAYLNREDVLKKLYSQASTVRAFGEIYPRVNMAEELANDTVINSILEDAIYSKSGYMNSFTHDNGINDQTIGYYKTAVDALLDNDKIEDVQETLMQGVTQVLRQYNVSTE